MARRALVAVAVMLTACSPGDGNATLPGPMASTTSSPAASPATTTSTMPAPAFGGHLRPVPVLFGSRVMLREPSGDLRDVTPEKTKGESIVDAFFVDPEHG